MSGFYCDPSIKFGLCVTRKGLLDNAFGNTYVFAHLEFLSLGLGTP